MFSSLCEISERVQIGGLTLCNLQSKGSNLAYLPLPMTTLVLGFTLLSKFIVILLMLELCKELLLCSEL